MNQRWVLVFLADRGQILGLVSYSESTRYTPTKYADALAWCRVNNRPPPLHTLYPRTRGFVATVQSLRSAPHVKGVYDLTIAYAERDAPGKPWRFLSAPTIWQSLAMGRLTDRWKFYVHVERWDIEGLPEGEEGLKAWLEEKWIEKGRRLEALRVDLMEGREWVGEEDRKDL